MHQRMFKIFYNPATDATMGTAIGPVVRCHELCM